MRCENGLEPTRSSAKADRTACPYCKQCGHDVKNDTINNIGTKVPQSESPRERIGQSHIGTLAKEGIGVGVKTARGKRPPATPEVSLGLGFSVRLGFRVRLRVRVRIRLTVSIHTASHVAMWLVS